MAQDDAELAGQASAARAGAGAHRVERTMLVELEHVPIGVRLVATSIVLQVDVERSRRGASRPCTTTSARWRMDGVGITDEAHDEFLRVGHAQIAQVMRAASCGSWSSPPNITRAHSIIRYRRGQTHPLSHAQSSCRQLRLLDAPARRRWRAARLLRPPRGPRLACGHFT